MTVTVAVTCAACTSLVHQEWNPRESVGIHGTGHWIPCCPQVCTGVMLYGYPMIKKLCGGLQEFMQKHDFKSIAEFKGG